MIDKLQVPALGGDEEAVVICSKRRALSYDTQLVARAHIVTLGDDVKRMVFGKLLLRDCVAVSHICAYWRWLAVNDPLLWTALAGSPARIPVLYARIGSTTAIDVQLDFRRDALDDIVSCISGYFDRMKSIRLITEDGRRVRAAVWRRVLDLLSSPGQSLQRLHLQNGDFIPPTFALAARGTTSRLRELVLLGILIPDFSLLPATLVSFAYGSPTCDCNVQLAFRDLQTILRTCPALKDLWLSVALPVKFAEIDCAHPPTVQLHRLWLNVMSDTTVTQQLLNFMTCRNMHHVDVCHFEDDLVHEVMQNLEGHVISILPSTMWDDNVCDIVATDSGDRSRYIRGAELEQMRTYPLLWSSLVSLTMCGDIKDRLEHPPPHSPCLQSLRLLYHPISDLRATARTIDPVQPWKLDNSDWQCPNLHTVEFALSSCGSQMVTCRRSVARFAYLRVPYFDSLLASCRIPA
ncbi:hypothetical protein EXIGLDRAFT_847233 [Exidia glandulosa HHB12029]|uniref:F-box domain-containing protein n=1 Tax=Exidia glandulosa HHB12029 TaxID=1314781 RepID=A0A166N3L0_EXIGL|nr:hypothetical protein EXIGLDRAFT_847233 [Exidia glandulosa HHB12029]